MTERVDFYVLNHSDARSRNLFACRLAEKAFLKQCNVLVLTALESEAREIDDLLWSFSDRSFVPHELHGGAEAPDPMPPVCVASDPGISSNAQLVLNLGEHSPETLERFARVAEIIDADEDRRRHGRERFKAYRERKITLETHQIHE